MDIYLVPICCGGFIAVALVLMVMVKRQDRKNAAQENANAIAKVREERRARVMRYPVRYFTQAAFDSLPKAAEQPLGFLQTVEIGTYFVCRPSSELPDAVIVGQVVKSEDVLAEQWGAGLAVPDRGINRYRVVISEIKAEPQSSSST